MAWSDLGDPTHAEGVSSDQEPMRVVIRSLQSRDYRHRYFGHWSLNDFAIGRLPVKVLHLDGYDEPLIWIEMDRPTGLLLVGQRGAEARWGMWKENGYWVRVGKWAYCTPEQALGLIDSIIAEAEA